MPFMQVDDRGGAPVSMFTESFLARIRSSAQHPSSQAAPPQLEDTRSSYRQMEAPKDAVWPRASIRPMPLLQGKQWWAVQIWDEPGVKAMVRNEDGLPIPTGIWLSSNFATLPEAMDWGAAEVEKLRPKETDTGPWGAAC